MTETAREPMQRRPLKSRDVRVFRVLAAWLARIGVMPNAISVMSMVFGAGAGAMLATTAFTEGWMVRLCWLAAAGLIQLRLLANMLDGMVAVDAGHESAVGELFNEAPDRVSDAATLVGAGFALGSAPTLGYLAAIMALLVAYLRALGASAGAGQAFHGPMAKPHRMFTLTVVCLYCGIAPGAWQPIHETTGWGIVAAALSLIMAGGLVTLWRRWRFIAAHLRSEATA